MTVFNSVYEYVLLGNATKSYTVRSLDVQLIFLFPVCYLFSSASNRDRCCTFFLTCKHCESAEYNTTVCVPLVVLMVEWLAYISQGKEGITELTQYFYIKHEYNLVCPPRDDWWNLPSHLHMPRADTRDVPCMYTYTTLSSPQRIDAEDGKLTSRLDALICLCFFSIAFV